MYKLYSLSILFVLFSSCTFLKSADDHKRFIEARLESVYKQKSIYQPNITDANYQEYNGFTFVDYFTSQRKGDGTFLTKMNIYQTYFEYESCQLPYPGMPGYVYKDRFGSRLKSILKEPLGVLEVRTAYDGENIYIIDMQTIRRPESDDDKSKWTVMTTLYNRPCN
jgi:hypothetical protein